MRVRTTISMRRRNGSISIVVACSSALSTHARRPARVRSATSPSRRARCSSSRQTCLTTRYASATQSASCSNSPAPKRVLTVCDGIARLVAKLSTKMPFTVPIWGLRSRAPSRLLRVMMRSGRAGNAESSLLSSQPAWYGRDGRSDWYECRPSRCDCDFLELEQAGNGSHHH